MEEEIKRELSESSESSDNRYDEPEQEEEIKEKPIQKHLDINAHIGQLSLTGDSSAVQDSPKMLHAEFNKSKPTASAETIVNQRKSQFFKPKSVHPLGGSVLGVHKKINSQ